VAVLAYAWLTEADARFASLAVIPGEVELITSMIVARIEAAAS
jgi:hypothetical protein